MYLQIALDVWTLEEAFLILDEVVSNVDIIEAGTPLVINEGIKSLNQLRQRYPNKKIMIDAKITDEFKIAKKAFDAGADFTTVLGILSDESVKAALDIGKQEKKEVFVDLMNVEDKVKRSQEVKKLGAKTVIVHCGIDEQKMGKMPLQELKSIKKNVDIKIAVAGGITLDTIGDYIQAKADIIIVGGSLIKDPKRKEISKHMKEKLF